MKVDRFQNYSVGVRNLAHAQKNDVAQTLTSPQAPSFGGIIPKLKLSEAAKTFINYLPDGEAKACKVMTQVKDFAEGEAAGIGITAIGTGLVAPWPIAYNPIVDYQLKKRGATPEEIEEKHKTQKYSAWRQPVSAVLAVIFQLGVQKPIQLMLDNWTNNPDYAHKFNGTIYNQSFFNGDKYLEGQIKKEIKSGSLKIEDVEVTDYITDDAGNKISQKRPARTIEEAVKQEKANRFKHQAEEISKAIKAIKEGDTQVIVKLKGFDNIVPTSALAESLNYQIEDSIKFAQGLRKNDLEQYVEKGRQLVDNEDTVRNLLNKENIEQNVQRIINDNPKLAGKRPAAIREFIKERRELYEQANNKDMVKILDRILNKCDGVIESSCQRTIDRIDKVKNACGGTFTPGAYFEHMYSKRNVLVNEKIENLEKLKISKEELNTISPIELKKRILAVADACHYDSKNVDAKNIFKDKGIFLSNIEKLRNLVYENVVKKGYKEVVKHKTKVSSQIVKACIATFIMLPITCTALNWVYPRFMDLFFPNLSGKKDAKPQEEGGAE